MNVGLATTLLLITSLHIHVSVCKFDLDQNHILCTGRVTRQDVAQEMEINQAAPKQSHLR